MSGKQCEAVVMLLGVIDLGTCTSHADTLVTGGCVHGHVKSRWLCAGHAGAPGAAMCRECFELPGGKGHECAVTFAPAEAVRE